MKKIKNVPENPQENQTMEELDNKLLEQVSGAGNPFKDFPRVPVKPIDDDVIGNG